MLYTEVLFFKALINSQAENINIITVAITITNEYSEKALTNVGLIPIKR